MALTHGCGWGAGGPAFWVSAAQMHVGQLQGPGLRPGPSVTTGGERQWPQGWVSHVALVPRYVLLVV